MDPKLASIIAQAQRPGGIPAILITRKHIRGRSVPLWLVMPFAESNRAWIGQSHTRHMHEFVTGRPFPHWTTPRTWLQDLARRLVDRFGACYLIQGLREKEQCAPKCWNAKGMECECHCMGKNHGEGQPGGRWYEVSETCAVGWGEKKLHYALIQRMHPKA